MRTTLLALMFLTASMLQAQATPTPYDCNFATTFNTATATSQSYYNKGPAAPCVAWRLTYNTVNATGVSISLQGTANLANGQPDPAGWTNLTPVQTTVNPAVGTNQGSIVACCDYYPWIRVTAGTFTGVNRSMSLTVLGYKGTTAHMLPPGSITGGPFAAGDVITGGGGQAITDSGVLLSALVVNPMTALGDMISGAALGAPARVVGNITTTQKFLAQTGTGAASTAPTWQAPPGAASPYPTVTDAAPIAWNLGSVVVTNGIVTLNHTTATRALNISNPVNGGFYTLVVKQDGTGGALMTLGTGCTWKVVNAGAGAIVLSAAASAIDVLSFTYDGANCYAILQSNFN